ncbi:hypothetical protein Tco_0180866 [Tanacetum coccineum]
MALEPSYHAFSSCAFLSPCTRGTLPLASRPANCNLVPMISRHLQPRTCNDELLEPAMWQAIIGQPSPCVSKWDPLDTSLLTLAVQRVNGQRASSTVNMSTSQINGSPCVGSGCHVSPPDWVHVSPMWLLTYSGVNSLTGLSQFQTRDLEDRNTRVAPIPAELECVSNIYMQNISFKG